MSTLTISSISSLTERSWTDILRTPCLAGTDKIYIENGAKKLVLIHNTSATNSATLTISTKADTYKRTVDPTAINPVTIATGKLYSLGPYPSALYGKGCDELDLEILVSGGDLSNLIVSVINLTVTPY